MSDELARFVFKIVIAFVFAMIVFFVVKPAFGFFGMVQCDSCGGLESGFGLIVVPVALAFIAIYRVVEVFQR